MLSLIKQIVNDQNESIDYSKCMCLIAEIELTRALDADVLDQFFMVAATGSQKQKIKSLLLLDFLFQNGDQNLLIFLQENQSVLNFASSLIVTDEAIQNQLQVSIKKWVMACHQKQVIKQSFAQWAKTAFTTQYGYKLTPQVYAKFQRDFEMAHELLILLNTYLQNANFTKDAQIEKEIIEMLHCTQEIQKRLAELKLTIHHAYFLEVIDYLDNYCLICKQVYINLKEFGRFDGELLFEIESRGMPKPKPQKVETQQLIDLSINDNGVHYPNLDNNFIDFVPKFEVEKLKDIFMAKYKQEAELQKTTQQNEQQEVAQKVNNVPEKDEGADYFYPPPSQKQIELIEIIQTIKTTSTSEEQDALFHLLTDDTPYMVDLIQSRKLRFPDPIYQPPPNLF